MRIKVVLISLILALLLGACGNPDVEPSPSPSNALQGSTPADLEIVEWQE